MSSDPGGPRPVEVPATEKRPEKPRPGAAPSPPPSREPAGDRNEDADARPAGPRRRWLWIVGFLILALVAFALLRTRAGKADKKAAAAQAQRAGRAVPVVAIPAKIADLPIYLTGLGTVSATNTVTVHSRVDGQLLRVDFREGQLVRKGDLIAEIDPRPFEIQLTQAEGQRGKDEAALANARLDFQRFQSLFQQSIIPQQQLDTQAATVRQLEATVKGDQGLIDSAKLNLVYARITAPITGTVGLKLVDPGNIVRANDANGIVVITQLSPIAVLFTIPADHLPPVQQQLKKGLKLPVEAWDRDFKNRLGAGTLLAVDNQIDPGTGTVRIKALFDNENGALFSNQFVNARLLVDTLRGAVVIPTAAIQRSPQSTFVWAVKPDSTVEMRNIEVQLTSGDSTAVRGAIASGDRVVVDGVDRLAPGSKVSPAGAAGSPAGGAPADRGGRPHKAAA
ncbi:MAG: MdtA/MuxA family multidrug efflux RND transporter periplasmic adaptor subunit [Acidobacteriota bacterium]